MTIIHYIPTMDPKAGTAPEYVECLVRATRNVAESHVITDSDLGDNIISIRKSIRGFVEKFRPDILHIHAAWSFKAAMVMKKATEMGVFTLLSVHGGLAPEVVDLDFWKQKLPRLVCYQLLMVRKCQALVAVSQEDYDSLKALGWKKRIVNIPHPALFHKSDEETKDLLMAIYHKVIDTNYLLRITEPEVLFVKKCVAIKMWNDNRNFDVTTSTKRCDEVTAQLIEETKSLVELHKDLSFKRIFIYAHDNGVTALMMEGAEMAGISMPSLLDINALPRFKQKFHKDKYAKSFNKLCKVISHVAEGKELTPTFTLSGSVSFHTVCQIFQCLRFSSYDEDDFSILAKKAGISKFTARLLQYISNTFYMEKGYMPILPDKKSL